MRRKPQSAFSSALFLLLFAVSAMAQAPNSFNYQAVVRDASGNVLQNQNIALRIAILQNSPTGTEIYAERHTKQTNEFGLVNLEIGTGTVLTGVFTSISWGTITPYLKIGIDLGGGTNYADFGSSKIASVPYAGLAGQVSYLQLDPVKQSVSLQAIASAADEDPIFEIKNKDGIVMLGVYNEGVRINVLEEESKGSKSGFAVGSFSRETKSDPTEIMRLTSDSIRFYIPDHPDGKSSKSGFAVGSFSRETKGAYFDLFDISPQWARIYIDDSGAKSSKSGFAVGSFSRETKALDNYFNISTAGDADIILDEPRILWYPKKEAFLAGRVLVEHPDSVGFNATATGYQSMAKGNYSQAFGYRAKARGDYSTSIGKNAIAGGHNSFAFGDNTVAGNKNENIGNAYAFGYGSHATGNNSYAFGNLAKSTGQDAFAIGSGTEASGTGSFALGFLGLNEIGDLTGQTKATANWAVAIGMGSQATEQGSFAIGTQTRSEEEYSMAMGYQTLASGRFATAIGLLTIASSQTSTAMGALSIASGLTSTAIGSSTEASGNSSTAMGGSTEAIGDASTSMGGHTKAIGHWSVAMGWYSQSSGLISTAMGRSTIASGEASTAMGNYTSATEYYATAMGSQTVASGWYSTAMGSGSIASGNTSTAMGGNTSATEYGATAMGSQTEASGYSSTAMGTGSIANGYASIAMGQGSMAESYASLAIGRYNIPEGNSTEWNSNDPLFIAGNGVTTVSRSNALVLRKNGNMTIAGTLTQLSDSRLKKNIKPLDGALSLLGKINPVWFEFQNTLIYPEGPQIGMIAQEIKELIPVLVSSDKNGILSVDYTKLSVVIWRVLQEQQQIILNLEQKLEDLTNKQNEIDQLKADLEWLKAMMQAKQ